MLIHRACGWLMNVPSLLWEVALTCDWHLLLTPGYSLPLEQHQVCALLAAPLEFVVWGLPLVLDKWVVL